MHDAFVNQLRQRYFGCIRAEMLQIVFENQSVDVDLADTCLDHALRDLVRPLVRAMSDYSDSSFRLLLDRLESMSASVTASHSMDRITRLA